MTWRALLLVLLLTGTAQAAPSPETLPDPAQESRARALQKQLRCVVCQGESLDDSNALIASDLRKLIREQIAAGKSDAQVKDWLVARYGDFILMKPPLEPATFLLWFGPAIVLLLGGAVAAVIVIRARRRAS